MSEEIKTFRQEIHRIEPIGYRWLKRTHLLITEFYKGSFATDTF